MGLGSDLVGPNQDERGRELIIRASIETPMEALAEILGISDETRTIEVGKLADLIAFKADPLSNTQLFNEPESIPLVMKAGQVVKDDLRLMSST